MVDNLNVMRLCQGPSVVERGVAGWRLLLSVQDMYSLMVAQWWHSMYLVALIVHDHFQKRFIVSRKMKIMNNMRAQRGSRMIRVTEREPRKQVSSYAEL